MSATGRDAAQVEEVRVALKELFGMMHQLDQRTAALTQLVATCVFPPPNPNDAKIGRASFGL